MLDRQHFLLTDWREADTRINWRRFFDITDLAALRKLTQAGQRFEPRMDDEQRCRKIEQWRRAVQAAIAFYRE